MKVTFVGGGNMANALIGGMRRQGHAAGDIQVVEPLAEARDRLMREFGVAVAATPAALASLGDVIVMAVKPQQMREAAAAVGPHLGKAVVLTIAAGIRLDDLKRWLGGSAMLVRCMPNTPALIGAGITGVFAAREVSASQRAGVEAILQAAGKVVWVDSEDLLDPVTAVSGSGPAYVFYFIEALQEAGQAMGLAADTARELAIETFRGAAELAARSAEPPATLRARVTSKGGTTERALASFDADQLKTVIARGVRAANARAAELAALMGKD